MDDTHPPRHQGNRHGRSEAARRAVLEAADDLLVEKGFAGVTIEGIATAAGVAKQTIYRWWSSKTDILLEALLQDADEDLTPPDHGTLAEDLRSYLTDAAAFLTRSDAGAVLRALLGHAQHDPAFAATLRTAYLEPQRRRDRVVLERAVQRGELPADFDVAAEADRLMAPIYYHALVSGEPVDQGFIDGLTAEFVATRNPSRATRRIAPE